MSKFGDAFKAARAAGDKTFMFNGKKYTTETADDVKRRDFIKKTGSANAGDAGEKEASPPKSMAPIIQYAKQYEPEMTDSFKKGGAVKGWGKARGARKAKMY